MASVKGRRFVLEMFVAARREIKTLKRGRGTSGSGRRLIWALFLLRAGSLRFAYFHQSFFLFESASGASTGVCSTLAASNATRVFSPSDYAYLCVVLIPSFQETDRLFFAHDLSACRKGQA